MISSLIPADETANALPATIEPNPKYRPPLTPHALCLTVFLSTSSFLHIADRTTGRKEMTDVKIDVYFNGSLCGSHHVPKRYAGEAHAMTEHIVRFTGHRIGRLIEKPWVIVPSGQNPDGGLRDSRRGKVAYAGAQQRWKDVSDSLLAEADRIGRDGSGHRPALGEYLETLAELPMPTEVEDMQKAGGPKFGVLDAVVTWGTGNKDGPDCPYITAPTPIRIEGCTGTNPNRSPTRHVAATATTPRSTSAVPQSRSEALATARSIDDYPTPSPLPFTASPIPPSSSNGNNKPNPYASSPPALPFETPVKRSRGPYYDIVTSKQTLCEEMDSIALASTFNPGAAGGGGGGGGNNNNNNNNHPASFQPTNARTTRASYYASSMAAAGSSSSPLSSAPATGEHTPVQPQTRTRFGQGKGASSSSSSSPTVDTAPPRRSGTGGVSDRELMAAPLFEGRTPAAAHSKGKERAAAPTQTQTNGEAPDRGFVLPTLSEDCRVTYAASGVVRNVGAARGGVFKEGGVVMGARFLVGG